LSTRQLLWLHAAVRRARGTAHEVRTTRAGRARLSVE
jgi:hypothetical protein